MHRDNACDVPEPTFIDPDIDAAYRVLGYAEGVYRMILKNTEEENT